MALPLIGVHQKVTTLLLWSEDVQTGGTLEVTVMNGHKDQKAGGRRRKQWSNLRRNAKNSSVGPKKKKHEKPEISVL